VKVLSQRLTDELREQRVARLAVRFGAVDFDREQQRER
jgi:hypothetical protein